MLSTTLTIWRRVNGIRDFFNTNKGYLLIIDEADKLVSKYTQKKMEILRAIFDQSDVGLVIAGEPKLEAQIKTYLARMANRVDFYVSLKGLDPSEVEGYKHYEIILSDSSEQAEGFLSDIKTELEENAALREDFGELEGRVWKASVILLSNGVKIEALGAGKKIRGRRHKQWRPDLILCDDLENDENVNTPEQRKKLRDWFYKAVSKAGDTYTDIVYIGTLLHYDALLANVAKNPEYEAVRYG